MKKVISALGAVALFFGCSSDNNKPEDTMITILQTADIHAYLNSHQELFVEDDSIVFRQAGGLANIKTLTEKVRSENPEGTIFLDGGDLIQGSGYSVLSNGTIFPPIIREMNYDLIIPGNWEVVYGKQTMMDLMQDYDTKVIAANMYHQQNQEYLFPPYWITEKQGVKIGFIAYNDPEVPIRQNPGFSEGISFTQVEHNLKGLITKLKHEEMVDVLFLVTHLGISKQVSLANNPLSRDVDFILGNDTHERIRKPIKGKYSVVMEPGAFGSFVGRLDLKLRNKKVIDYSYELMEVNPDKYPADPKLQSMIDEAKAPFNKEMQRVLAYSSTPMFRYLVVENPMDNMITDALRWKTGVDIAVSNGFRFGVPIVPDQRGKVPITKADLWRMLPVDEHMKIGEVSGQQIKDWLEKEINNVFAKDPSKRFGGWLVRFSGLTLKFKSSNEIGERVLDVQVGGKPLVLDQTYKMASCNRTGEELNILCRMRNAENVTIQQYTLHDAVEEYLKMKGTVSPVMDGRAIAVDLDPFAFSQMPGTDYRFR